MQTLSSRHQTVWRQYFLALSDSSVLMLVFKDLLSSICVYFRYRSGGGKSQNQNELTVEELRCFVRQFDNLPCNIRQAPLLKVSELLLDALTSLHPLYNFSDHLNFK